MKVPGQDLEAHHKMIRKDLEAAAIRVIASGRYILGPEVAAFEEEAAAALGVAHAIGVSSGTDALLVLLMALDVGPGDEVVTTPFSFFATAGAIARLGARPVFADIEPDTMNLDPAAAAARIGPRTKVVMTVHLFGRVARTAGLVEACAAAGVPLIEDAAQAIGARGGGSATGARVGTLGTGAALSFFPSKNLGGFGDAGMVMVNDPALDRKVRVLRAHGAAAKYHHLMVGGNFRIDEMQAALLRVKLPHLSRWSALRRMAANRYRKALADLPVGVPPDDPGCVWNQFVIRVDGGRRDPLAAALAADGIATAVYYPEPLSLQPCFAGLGHKPGDFPQAERACAEALALPIYPELAAESIDAACGSIARFFG